MYLYQKIGSAKNTTYTVKKYHGELASFISSLAAGLTVEGKVATVIASVIGAVAGHIISVTSSITLSCKAYAYSYYGKDSSSGLKSKTLNNCGHKYIINDDNHTNFKNKVYYDGFVYGKIDDTTDYNLSVMIINNLYGEDFDVN